MDVGQASTFAPLHFAFLFQPAEKLGIQDKGLL
jgi:hypothetical protein